MSGLCLHSNCGLVGAGGAVGALVAGRTVGTMRWVGVGDAAEVGDASGVGVSSGVAVARGVKVGRGVRVGVAVAASSRAEKVVVSQASILKTTMRNTLIVQRRFRSNRQLLSERQRHYTLERDSWQMVSTNQRIKNE